MEFIRVPGGVFMMGDVFGDGDNDEQPVHEVELDDFYIGKYPVMQGQWKKLMGDNPSHFKKGNDYPVESVSWIDVQEYIHRLTAANAGKYRFRLPTEAEWEYAARSRGKKEKFSGSHNADAVGWYRKDSRSSTQPVGRKLPNGLGLYDMSGNVWEWCEDIYHRDAYHHHQRRNPLYVGEGSHHRVIRGGSWRRDDSFSSCMVRRSFPPDDTDNAIGFRLVRVIEK